MSAAAGTKRKRASIPKFYAVRYGHKPGIYNSWEECRRQIDRFKGATYKSFPSLSEAQRFVSGQATSTGTNKFYAVKSGRVPGIYTSWPAAQEQIRDWPKPRHKCFATRAEATRFLDDEELEPKRIRADDNQTQPHTHLDPASVKEDGFDDTVTLHPTTGKIVKKTPLQAQATKLMTTVPTGNSFIRVYTDGSSLGNGRRTASAGVGVYFGPGDQRNISEPLQGARQTNQRAELTAIQRALDALPRDRNVEIVTDSQYSIKCVSEWCINWRRNGWRNSQGKPVENKDLVEAILQKVTQREKEGAATKYTWVKGHASDPGNIAADRLAVEGARAVTGLPASVDNEDEDEAGEA